MRLLDSITLKLSLFTDNEVPPYAILSHTWGKEEVSYAEMLKPSPATTRKAGYIKIKEFARLASTHWKYVWVDTCCIQKDSSAELSEAINSMYQWYKNAQRCYVYLEDMDGSTTAHGGSFNIKARTSISSAGGSRSNQTSAYPDTESYMRDGRYVEGRDILHQQEAFQKCRWLTRGYTLQELIAPSDVQFFSRDWEFLWTKQSWNARLAMITGIGRDVLTTCDPTLASVAQRMSWVSGRVTTRSEDLAYCMLGIFDVNMPMLYGEGSEKAFIRLQEEIMKSSDDHSIFAWRTKEASHSSYVGLLAPHPRYFIASRNVASMDDSSDDRPSSITNKGISLALNLIPVETVLDETDVFVALLNCRDPGHEGERIGIFLKKLHNSQYARVDAHRIFNAINPEDLPRPGPFLTEKATPTNIYVRQRIRLPPGHSTPRMYGFQITEFITNSGNGGLFVENRWPPKLWDPKEKCFRIIPSEDDQYALICYKDLQWQSNPAIVAVLLRWNGISKTFGCKVVKDGSWLPALPYAKRVERLRDIPGDPMTPTTSYRAPENRLNMKVEMKLGMWKSEVVINVNITVT